MQTFSNSGSGSHQSCALVFRRISRHRDHMAVKYWRRHFARYNARRPAATWSHDSTCCCIVLFTAVCGSPGHFFASIVTALHLAQSHLSLGTLHATDEVAVYRTHMLHANKQNEGSGKQVGPGTNAIAIVTLHFLPLRTHIYVRGRTL